MFSLCLQSTQAGKLAYMLPNTPDFVLAPRTSSAELQKIFSFLGTWETRQKFSCKVEVLCSYALPIVHTSFYTRSSNLLGLEKIPNKIW